MRSSSAASESDARLDQPRVEDGEGGLQAGDAEGCLLERNVLLVARVRRVVGRDRLDRPVAERLEQRLPVRLGAERRVHLQVRVERADDLVGEAQVVRRDLAVACTPAARARRSSSTDSRAERCRRWSGCSSYAASARSRPTITLSATDG